MVLNKLLGAGLIFAGAALVFVFPDIFSETSYQPKQFAHSAILIGLILIIAGAYLLLV